MPSSMPTTWTMARKVARTLGLAVATVGLGLCACSKSNSGVGADAGAPSPSTSAATSQQENAIPAPPDVGEVPGDATRTPSGLAWRELLPGAGTVHPTSTDRVKVHYTGWTKSGQMFDSSVQRGAPMSFQLSQVIPGWTEGLQLMVVGQKCRFWIPSALAYGDHPRMGAPAGDLVFDIELLDITAGPKPPPVPEDVSAPPASAKKTASGLAYRVLSPGKGTEHPSPTSQVTVNYSGWTTDGKMFDSSIMHGKPAQFGVGNVIKGWTEGLQLMTKGEKARFWIPGPLAYGDKPTRPGVPAGMLVFDVELLDFK